MRRTAVTVALLAMALPARGQNVDLKELFSGSTHPLTVKMKDLNTDWRRFSVGSSGGDSGMGGFFSMIMGMLGGAMGGGGGTGAYYTKGETVNIGGETFIVAYRIKPKPMDPAAFTTMMGPGSKPPIPDKVTEETVLSLSLLSVRGTPSLNDIRPFDMKTEIEESENSRKAMQALGNQFGGGEGGLEAPADEGTSLGNLKQLGTALLMYVQDYDEVLPPMQDAQTAKKVLQPYVKNESIFVNPDTKEPYQPNPILSKKKLAHMTAPAEMVAFYEPTPAMDGTRGVVFLDGHAKRVQESEWPRLKRASKIP
jgi:hypothetical protein